MTLAAIVASATKTVDTSHAQRMGRQIEVSEHYGRPPGLEAHADGRIVHEVQKGDSWYALARDYNRSFHTFMDWTQLRDANPQTGGSLFPGQQLTIPGLETMFDIRFNTEHPHLVRQGNELVHDVQPGDNLTKIARDYSATEGLNISATSLYNANKAVIGADPNLIHPHQKLRIPGITFDDANAFRSSLRSLDGVVIATRAARILQENRDVTVNDVMTFRIHKANARPLGKDLTAAMAIAKYDISRSDHANGFEAVVQSRNGSFWLIPMEGTESGELDHTGTTLSLQVRREERSMVGYVQKDWGGTVTTRQFEN